MISTVSDIPCTTAVAEHGMRDEHTAACAATRLVCHLHGPCQVPQLQLRHCGALMALDKRRIQRHGRLGIPRRVGGGENLFAVAEILLFGDIRLGQRQ